MLKVWKWIKVLKDTIAAVQAEKSDDGTLTLAEILEQVGKLLLRLATEMGEDVTTDGDPE